MDSINVICSQLLRTCIPVCSIVSLSLLYRISPAAFAEISLHNMVSTMVALNQQLECRTSFGARAYFAYAKTFPGHRHTESELLIYTIFSDIPTPSPTCPVYHDLVSYGCMPPK